MYGDFNITLTYFYIFASLQQFRMTLYQRLTENLQFFAPKFYKKRYFKNLENISEENYSQRNVEPELIWIKDFLPQDAVFIDIGANVGSFLYQIEKKLNSKNIYAFEPNQKLNQRLKRIFPEIKIYPFALSDKNETATFKIPVINGRTYDSRGTLQTDLTENGETKHIVKQVQVVKFDDWVTGKNLHRIEFIKIDVEGNEMQTLCGAKNSITKFRPVLMVEMEQRHHRDPLQDLVAEIENWDYTAHYLDRQTFKPEKLKQDFFAAQTEHLLKNKKQYINNIIFIPKNSKNS